MDETTAANNN